MKEFFRQLRRRKVFVVAAAYAAVAWLVLQVADTVFPTFDAPPWVMKVVTVLLALGFPIAILLSWAYDITPEGVVKTDASPEPKGEAASPPAREDEVALPSGPSIAVIPFRNLSGDGEQELFAQALTSDITSGLTQSSHLFVLAASATVGLEDAESDPARAGRTLGVKYVLGGTVQRAGGALRVSAQLTDVENSVRIWSHKYDRDLSAENLFAVQDDIREQIVATLSDLHGVIYSTQTKKNVHRPTTSLNAYECLSVALAYDKTLSEKHHLRARESLERAIEIDPGYDEAWSHLSWIYTDEYVFGYNPLPNAMERALDAARKGVELAPDNYHNHWLLSRVHYFSGNRDLFFAEAQRALDLNASDGTTLGLIGLYTAFCGEWERGVDMLKKAALLNPKHPDYYHTAFGCAAIARGDYEAALESLHKANLPEWTPHQILLIATYALSGRGEDAQRTLKEFSSVRPDFDLNDAKASLEMMFPYLPDFRELLIEGLKRAGMQG